MIGETTLEGSSRKEGFFSRWRRRTVMKSDISSWKYFKEKEKEWTNGEERSLYMLSAPLAGHQSFSPVLGRRFGGDEDCRR